MNIQIGIADSCKQKNPPKLLVGDNKKKPKVDL